MLYYIICIFIYIIIELINIIKYYIIYEKINNKYIIFDKIKSNFKKEFLIDLCTYGYDYLNLKDLFFNKIKIKDINKKDITKCYYEMTTNYYTNNKYYKKLSQCVDIIEKKYNLNFSTTSKLSKNRLKWRKMNIRCIYSPLLLDIIKFFFRQYGNNNLYNLKFKKYDLKKNYTIWTNGYDKKKGTPIVFFHCSIGGLIFYEKLLNEWHDKFNLIMPEIPGMSWQKYSSNIPSINEMTNMLFNFIDINYPTISKFNFVGHSFGSNITAYVINTRPDRVKNALIVEGGVFIPNLLLNVTDYNTLSIYDVKLNELVFYPFYYGCLYVQYYFQKELSMNNMLFAENSFKSSFNIHFIYSQNDVKLDPKPQIKYIKKKKIKCKYTLFTNCVHGSLINKISMVTYARDILLKWI